MPDSSRLARFGVFELDLRSGELRKSGTRLNLPDQPLHILTALLERPGDLVTREELRQRLWPSDTFVDFEHGLNAAVKRLRDVLGDSADTPGYIETVPRRGYRLIALVEGMECRPAPSPLRPPNEPVVTESVLLEHRISSLHRRLLASSTGELTRLFYEARQLLSQNPHNPDVLVLLDQLRSAMDPSAFAATMGNAATAAILSNSSSPDLAYAYARSAARGLAVSIPDVQTDSAPTFCWLGSEMGRLPLGKGDNVLGSEDDSRIVLASSTVSRRHALIRVRDAVVTIEDLNSATGTYVGAERLRAPRELREDDRIRIGAFQLTFHLSQPAVASGAATGGRSGGKT